MRFGVAATTLASFAAIAMLAAAAPAQTSDPKPPEATESDAVKAAKATAHALEQAVAGRPGDPALRYYLAHFQLEAGDKKAALATLGTIPAIADGVLPTPAFFSKLADDPEYQKLHQQFEARLPHISKGRVLYRHTDRAFLPESIAAHGSDIYIASLRSGDIVRIRDGRTPSIFRKGDPTPRLGLRVDAPRQRLCSAVTNAVLEMKDVARISHIECLDLTTGKQQSRITLPDAQRINDLAIDPVNGTIYVSDSAGGAVWKITPDKRFVKLVDNLSGANGLTLDGRGALYVAHNTGIARVDIATGKLAVSRLTIPSRQTVAGIDGLYWYKGSLIGVQNVLNPGRVIKMDIGPDGAISRVTTLQSHHDRWVRQPTTAAVVGDKLYLLATTQINRMGPGGVIDDPDSIEPAVIVEIPLR